MNPVFEILPASIEPQQTNIVCEVSDQGVAYVFEDDESKAITGLSVFHFDGKAGNSDHAELIQKIFREQEVLQRNYNRIFINYSFPENVLIPEHLYKPEASAAMLDLIYGDLEQKIIFTDLVAEKNLYSVYRISANIHHAVIEQFPLAGFAHQYSIIAKLLSDEGSFLQVIFYPNKIIVCLVNKGQLVIIQTFYYKTGEDVVYNLLNVCNQFGIKHIALKLYGMIEKDSALFKEMHKYFLHITFGELEDTSRYFNIVKEYPIHFFSYLFSVAACV